MKTLLFACLFVLVSSSAFADERTPKMVESDTLTISLVGDSHKGMVGILVGSPKVDEYDGYVTFDFSEPKESVDGNIYIDNLVPDYYVVVIATNKCNVVASPRFQFKGDRASSPETISFNLNTCIFSLPD